LLAVVAMLSIDACSNLARTSTLHAKVRDRRSDVLFELSGSASSQVLSNAADSAKVAIFSSSQGVIRACDADGTHIGYLGSEGLSGLQALPPGTRCIDLVSSSSTGTSVLTVYTQGRTAAWMITSDTAKPLPNAPTPNGVRLWIAADTVWQLGPHPAKSLSASRDSMGDVPTSVNSAWTTSLQSPAEMTWVDGGSRKSVVVNVDKRDDRFAVSAEMAVGHTSAFTYFLVSQPDGAYIVRVAPLREATAVPAPPGLVAVTVDSESGVVLAACVVNGHLSISRTSGWD
jgi:hypothetical protein